MSSAARIEANQQNARRSTGPTTEEGKQKSSLNAVKHGFLANVLPQEKSEYHELLEGLYDSFRPQDEFQRTLVDQIAIATIRLRRIYQAELEMVEGPRLFRKVTTEYRGNAEVVMEEQLPPPMAEFLKSDSTRNMIRYEVMCQRQIQRNVKLLESLKGPLWKQFQKKPCPYLPDSQEGEEGEPAEQKDDHTFEEVLAQARQARLSESAELDAALGRPRRNRNRNRRRQNGFVSQNQSNPHREGRPSITSDG